MAARVFRCHGKRCVGFFGKAHLKLNRLSSVIERAATAIYHQRILGIDQVAIVSCQLLYRLL